MSGYDQDASYLGSSQGTPKNYADGPAQGYARNPVTADQGARPLDVSTRPYNPITVANDPELDASVRAGNAAVASRPMAIPNTQPQGRGVVGTAVDFAKDIGGTVSNALGGLPEAVHRIGNSPPSSGPISLAAGNTVQLGVNPSTAQPRTMYGNEGRGNGFTSPSARQTSFTGTGDAVNDPSAPAQPYGQVVQSANQAMANNYSDRLAAEDARRPNSQELASAKRDAEIARFRATDGADMVLGSPRLYAAQRAAIVQNAADATSNATRLDNLARGASQVTPPNLVQGAVAQTEADQKARGSAFDTQKGSIAVAGGKQALQKGAQDLQASGLQLHTAQHLADLQKRALSGDTKANDMLALYQKAQSGKGGPITDEDKLKLYDDMVSRAVAMGGPEAYKSLPDFQTLSAHMDGRQAPPPADWMARAKAANPGADEDALTKLYAQKAR